MGIKNKRLRGKALLNLPNEPIKTGLKTVCCVVSQHFNKQFLGPYWGLDTIYTLLLIKKACFIGSKCII